MDARKEELRDRYLLTYRECKKFRYFPTAFLKMITSDEDVVEVTRRLIHKEGGTDGFTTLFMNRRMDLSVENIILEPRFRGLFSNVDLQTAYSRLKEYQYEALDQIEAPDEN